MREQQRDTDRRNQRPEHECTGDGLVQEDPAQDGIGHHQQGEHHCDQARGDIGFGIVDEREVERELEEAEQGRPAHPPRDQQQRFAAQGGKREHAQRGDYEAV